MPNYCDNSLTIYASEETVERIREFVRSNESEFDFNQITPMPKHIYDGPVGAEERELYGRNNWYDWRMQNWGTKWNSDEVQFGNDNFNFLTAWTPASPVVAELARRFPEADFWFQYEGMNEDFCGVQVYQSGRLVYEMEGDLCRNWTLEDAGDTDEDELQEYLIDDDLFPMQQNGVYIFKDAEGHFYLREYREGKIYECIDGDYEDFRAVDSKLAYWNENTEYLFFDGIQNEKSA